MDIIQLTRALGKAIQEEPCYIAMQIAKQACDEDTGLQAAIGEFNLKKMAINNEVQKPDRDEETVRRLNDEFRQVYAEILKNENMTKYNESKTQLDTMMQRVNAIVTQSAEGEDPETTDYDPASCGGDCSGCSGCH